jgi:hypothetical protein
MTPRRRWLFAIMVVLVACRDVAAPPSEAAVADLQVSWPSSSAAIHMLRQAADAPPLETYQVSFWACDGEASTLTVNYQAVGGQSVGQPFLRFDVPKNSLMSGPDGVRYKRGDSVLVTLTIDPVTFAVEFQPSGVWFSNGMPAQLTIWYENADPDLSGDGVVDATDQMLQQQISMWGHAADTRWVRLPSDNDATLPSVSTVLHHFSEYAASW